MPRQPHLERDCLWRNSEENLVCGELGDDCDSCEKAFCPTHMAGHMHFHQTGKVSGSSGSKKWKRSRERELLRLDTKDYGFLEEVEDKPELRIE